MKNKFKELSKTIHQQFNIYPSIYLSPTSGYRSRCKFGYKNNKYTMIDNNQTVHMDSFKLAIDPIQKIMPQLLRFISKDYELSNKLFSVNFRSNGTNVIATLIYHREISDIWLQSANYVEKNINNLNLIGRAKNILLYQHEPILWKEEEISGFKYHIAQDDEVFFQPNHYLLSKMIKFLLNNIDTDAKDLLEIYSGCGTFTLPLSYVFNQVLATENNRSCIRLMNKSIAMNNINNISCARLSDSETAEAINGKSFNRLGKINIEKYQFSHVLVDPPRSGLSKETIKLIRNFKKIIYISCNFESFIRDMNSLNNIKLKNISIFDQFASTDHIELIAILSN